MAKISDKIAELPPEARYFSLEFFPPKTQAGTENIIPRLTRLAQLKPLFVTVTWGAGGSTASKSLELVELCQKIGLETCLHLTCTNMRRSVLDHALAELKRMGVRNILALRGDEPRPGEYGENGFSADGDTNGSAEDDGGIKFTYAIDLVKYIRQEHGDYFCIGVAAYPEGHATSAWPENRSIENDIPFLVEKTKAGANFIMTQLFYDVDAYLSYVERLRNHESGVFKDVSIIPGLMPIQSWASIRRITKLCCAKIPPPVLTKLEQVKGDDELVKEFGLDALVNIIDKINAFRAQPTQPQFAQGIHLYTLNLEKVVAQILERCKLLPRPTPPADTSDSAAIEDGPPMAIGIPLSNRSVVDRRRLSSVNANPHNRAIVSRSSESKPQSNLEAYEDEAGIQKEKTNTRENALAIAEGEGSLGREATWDDFPNGRWGDARSPAYGSIDGYGPNLHVGASEAVKLWGHPATAEDISSIFKRYLEGQLSAVPWSEESLSAETGMIKEPLLQMNERGWWTVASQPAVNCASSGDPVVGWGPRQAGFVWQKPFVEFFIPATSWATLKVRLDEEPTTPITYFAGDSTGTFVSNDEENPNPVTWGAFKGKEIKTPTIIEAQSFKAWQDEAFGIWREWERIYPPRSPSAKLLSKLGNSVWLVNVIGHDYMDEDGLWKLLLS